MGGWVVLIEDTRSMFFYTPSLRLHINVNKVSINTQITIKTMMQVQHLQQGRNGTGQSLASH